MDNLHAMIRPIVNVVTTADIVCSQKKKSPTKDLTCMINLKKKNKLQK
jgi:hypothetical protein